MAKICECRCVYIYIYICIYVCICLGCTYSLYTWPICVYIRIYVFMCDSCLPSMVKHNLQLSGLVPDCFQRVSDLVSGLVLDLAHICHIVSEARSRYAGSGERGSAAPRMHGIPRTPSVHKTSNCKHELLKRVSTVCSRATKFTQVGAIYILCCQLKL